jgi:TonB family protein
MKKIIGLTLLAAISFKAFSQEQSKSKKEPEQNLFKPVGEIDTSTVFKSLDEMPEFKGGQQGLTNYLKSNIVYPGDAKQKNIQGRVVVKFVVCTDGSLCDEQIIKSVDSSLDKEVLRVVKSMPNWKPGRKQGQNVKAYYTLPVSFKFQGQVNDTIPDARDYLMTKSLPTLADSIAGLDTRYKIGNEEVFTSVEVVPQFSGGAVGLNKFLAENITYPPKAREDNIQGRIVVQFVVSKDGSIINVELKRDIGGGCGAEGIRVVESMPKWKPGTQNGKPVNVLYILPITFRLSNK